MIITTNEFLNCGLPISEEVEESKLEYCIKTAEQFLVKPRLKDQYIEITSNPENYPEIINGGIVTKDDKQIELAGLKQAMYELAFSELLMENVTATIFGSVVKNDEFSNNLTKDDLYMTSKRHVEIGLAYIKEITEYLGIYKATDNLNNWNEEFI